MSAPKGCRPWTAADLETLHWMRANGDENPQIAEALGRSLDSVKAKIRKETRSGAVARRASRPQSGTAAERALLASLHAAGKTDAEKAAALGWTLYATMWLMRRGLREGWVLKSPFFWTPEDEATLSQLRSGGLQTKQIADRMGRSLCSVRAKIQSLIQRGLIASLRDDGRFAAKLGIPAAKLADYRLFRSNLYTPAEATSFCRGAARP